MSEIDKRILRFIEKNGITRKRIFSCYFMTLVIVFALSFISIDIFSLEKDVVAFIGMAAAVAFAGAGAGASFTGMGLAGVALAVAVAGAVTLVGALAILSIVLYSIFFLMLIDKVYKRFIN